MFFTVYFGFMKFALCQINPTVGALEANSKKILTFAKKAKSAGADIAVFPELSLCGYPPKDLLEKKNFIDKNLEKTKEIIQTSPLPLIFGYVDINEKKTGKPLHNAALFVNGPKITSRHHKVLLPTYDVFHETRYFEPGYQVKTTLFNNKKLAIVICEDSWNNEEFWQRKPYPIDPVEKLMEEKPDVLINISASPYSIKWYETRVKMLTHIAKKYKIPIVYVNQVGSNDDLIFDGQSFALNAQGEIVAQALSFEEDIVLFDLEKQSGEKHPIIENEIASVYHALVLGIKDYVKKCRFEKVVLGLSGGIDSALVAALASDALGQDNVLCLMMPSQFNSPAALLDATQLAKNLKINTHTLSIEPLYKTYLETLKKPFAKTKFNETEENIQARIRGNLLMAFSNKFGHLVLSTGNKSEMAVGYCTLYGDMSGGLCVLGDVPKTLVYKLAAYKNQQKEIIPKNIFTKPPSAELRPNQTDQDSLPPYEILDDIMKAYVEDHLSLDEIIKRGLNPDVVKKILKLIDQNEYKRRQAALTLRITTKAFGSGRHLPIAQGYTTEILK